MKKVYPAEWMKRHPYDRSDETARYYADYFFQKNRTKDYPEGF